MKVKRVAVAVPALGLLTALGPEAAAQGCALCRASAEAAGANQAGVFDAAILVLLAPTLLIFAGILFFALRYRFRGGGDDQSPASAEELLPFIHPPDQSSRPDARP
jgi:hypothetical protein